MPTFDERRPDSWFQWILLAAGGDLSRYDEVKRRAPIYRIWACAELELARNGVKPGREKGDE